MQDPTTQREVDVRGGAGWLVALGLVAVVIATALMLLWAGTADARPSLRTERLAITYAFCGHQFKVCRYASEAFVVAALESSGCTPRTCDRHDLWTQGRCADAGNGQYDGCFQMGASERKKYGHGAGVWDQARAAFRYFVSSGRDWSPWSCKPWGVCYR